MFAIFRLHVQYLFQYTMHFKLNILHIYIRGLYIPPNTLPNIPFSTPVENIFAQNYSPHIINKSTSKTMLCSKADHIDDKVLKFRILPMDNTTELSGGPLLVPRGCIRL